jgi:uncharacterized GH25 family protein
MKNVKSRSLLSLALFTGLLISGLANAHQFWLQPSDYAPKPGEQVSVFIKTGHGDKLESFPRNAQHFTRFVVIGPSGETTVTGQEGADPAGWVKPAKAGMHAVVYESVATRSEMEPERFEAYLREESLDAVISERAKRGETSKPGNSTYVRCAKSLLNVGNAAPAAASTNFGLALELSIDKGLSGYRPGRPVTFTLQFEGKPAPGVLVSAMDTRDPNNPISARTDPQGKVTLALPKAAEWLVSAVHMIPARAGKPADWESFRASLTFMAAPAGK